MSFFQPVTAVNVTLDNLFDVMPQIMTAIGTAAFIGLDIESEQSRAHPGIVSINTGNKLVFDTNRTTICGLSLWCDGAPEAFYFNLGHSDVEGRIPWHLMEQVLSAKLPTSKWIVHNAPFELTMLAKSVGWDMKDYICSLQLCVSAYGPDEYDLDVFKGRDLGGMAVLITDIKKAVAAARQTETPAVMDLLNKVIAKQSDASHSYNGWVKDMTYGYGLKKAVKSWFGYDMASYEQCLAGWPHMGCITSAQATSYGCEDAVWAVRLFHRVLKFMMDTNPAVVGTYFSQELPMTAVYASTWQHGVKINVEAVKAKQIELRADYAHATRELKGKLRAMLPFPALPNESLARHDAWYDKSWQKYRAKVETWATSPDSVDDYAQATQLSGAIPNAWTADRGLVVLKEGLNVTFYMTMRTIMYDLFRREHVIAVKGKTQSDAYARGRLMEAMGPGPESDVMEALGKLATIEQSSKLYITPYLKLIDPDTGRIYSVTSSLLASRRLAMRDPNAQQLAKRGETVYVRTYYDADHDDHVIVSLDWSQVELVLIGEQSGDPFFAECYAALPYSDLHVIAAADGLAVPLEEFMALKNGATGLSAHLYVNPKGEAMEPKQAYKYWRTELGKGSGFSYWYSGALNVVGERMGWTSDEMFAMSDRYRAKFAVGEEWRVGQIAFGQANGFVNLPDGHRRVRFEATAAWKQLFMAKWARYNTPDVKWFAEKVCKRIQSRANNQLINSEIQGSCATLAKRSVPAVNVFIQTLAATLGMDTDRLARFMFLVHDELVFSVHRDHVVPFVQSVSKIMCDHPSIVKNLVLDCSASVGLNFAPWDAKKSRLGQMELREAPPIPCVPPELVGKELPAELWPNLVNWLFAERAGLNV